MENQPSLTLADKSSVLVTSGLWTYLAQNQDGINVLLAILAFLVTCCSCAYSIYSQMQRNKIAREEFKQESILFEDRRKRILQDTGERRRKNDST